MNILPVVTNTPEWMAVRALHDTASEAPAALGLSKYQSRAALLKQKATGLTEEVGGAKQALFDRGHQSEADARPLAESIIGSDLYPVTANLEIEGLLLLASLDGATMMEDEIWEHKLYSESLAADVQAGTLSPHYTIQMDQQLLVSGAKRCLFMTSDGTDDKMAWCWYESSPEKFAALIAGWKQFHADLEAYLQRAVDASVVGRTPETLPALHIVMRGEVSASNLAEFKEVALTAIRSVNRDLKTDQDFADSAKARAWCSDIESRVAAAKSHAMSQTKSIDDLFRALDEVSAEAKDVRLALEKLEKARKESRRGEIVAGGVKALSDHVAALNARIGWKYMPNVPCDFGGAIKGLRTFDSMQNAVDTALANAKIAASATADKITLNMKAFDSVREYAFLFHDVSAQALKEPEYVAMLIKNRIAEHQAAEAKKEADTRERIRAEEQEKAERAARAKMAEEHAEADKLARETAAKAQAEKQAQDVIEAAKLVPVPKPAPAHPEWTLATAPPCHQTVISTPPTLRLGQINDRLHPIQITAEGLRTLGFESAGRERASVLYHESQFPLICAALVKRINSCLAVAA